MLNIGQPTVTEQVKSLELTFGVELFHRRGRTVTLTDTGRQLLGFTQDIFGHEEEAVGFLTAQRDLKHGLAFAGVELGDTLEINSREAVMEGIIRGLGIGAVLELEYVAHDRLRAIRIADADIFISFYVVCLNSRRTRPLIQAFLNTAEAIARTNAPPPVKNPGQGQQAGIFD